jgi:hypothetical protein
MSTMSPINLEPSGSPESSSNFKFTSHDLIVTTTKGVYVWNGVGTVELFSSGSSGIVTATKVQIEKDLLAVADSQVVILHDLEQGMQQTYKLRREDQVRIPS